MTNAIYSVLKDTFSFAAFEFMSLGAGCVVRWFSVGWFPAWFDRVNPRAVSIATRRTAWFPSSLGGKFWIVKYSFTIQCLDLESLNTADGILTKKPLEIHQESRSNQQKKNKTKKQKEEKVEHRHIEVWSLEFRRVFNSRVRYLISF